MLKVAEAMGKTFVIWLTDNFILWLVGYFALKCIGAQLGHVRVSWEFPVYDY